MYEPRVPCTWLLCSPQGGPGGSVSVQRSQDCDKDITGHVHWKGSILLVSWGGALGGRGV